MAPAGETERYSFQNFPNLPFSNLVLPLVLPSLNGNKVSKNQTGLSWKDAKVPRWWRPRDHRRSRSLLGRLLPSRLPCAGAPLMRWKEDNSTTCCMSGVSPPSTASAVCITRPLGSSNIGPVLGIQLGTPSVSNCLRRAPRSREMRAWWGQ